jgi:hypothetical protein
VGAAIDAATALPPVGDGWRRQPEPYHRGFFDATRWLSIMDVVEEDSYRSWVTVIHAMGIATH